MCRYFTIADYDREEEFLREQHRRGYKFVRFMLPCFYYFEACEPEDVIYRLDFSGTNREDKQSYRQMFEDYGWEYMFDAVGWSYFRRPAAEKEEDNAIFSDAQSRLDLIGRITKRRMVPILVVFFCCLLPNIRSYYHTLNWVYIMSNFWWTTVISALLILLFGFYTWLVIHCVLGMQRLKKKYMAEKI